MKLISSTWALTVWHVYDLGSSEFDGTVFDCVERTVLATFGWLAILLNDTNQFAIQITIKFHNGFAYKAQTQSSNCQRNYVFTHHQHHYINGMRKKNELLCVAASWPKFGLQKFAFKIFQVI